MRRAIARRLVVLVALGAIGLPGARLGAQDSQQAPPTSAESQVSETLAHDALIFQPPPEGWKPLGRNATDQRAGYSAPDDGGLIVISATLEPQTIPERMGPKFAADVVTAIKSEAAKGNIQSVLAPTVEKDARFLVKIHDRFISQNKPNDRLLLDRGVGRYLVTVVATAATDDPEKAAALHAIGEQVAMSVQLNRPGATIARPATTSPAGASAHSGAAAAEPGAVARPVLFSEAHLRVTPPAGWTARGTGAASGLIADWREPADPTNLITLTYRRIPAQAARDDGLRDLAIEQLASGEQPSFQAAGGAPVGAIEKITDKRFLRKTRARYDVKGVQVIVSFRQVRAGDGVASVTSIAMKDKADAIDAIADKLATEIRATGG